MENQDNRTKSHYIIEINKNISNKRYQELKELCEKTIKVLKSTSMSSELEKYRISLEAFENLKTPLEKDLFASNIAFPDNDILVGLLKLNDINVMDILALNEFCNNKQETINAYKKINLFKEKYYKHTLVIDLINKINQIILFEPELFNRKEEETKTKKR